MTGTRKYGVKHGAGFILSGVLATLTDALVLTALTRGAGLDPYSARVIAIACAMVIGFFAHRRLTFAVTEPATLAQFTKFLSVAATASLVNYAIYAGMLLLRPGTDPLVSLLVATVVATGISYAGLRFGVFRAPDA
ncbi:MAG: GtrA family protein [Hyphomicrobium sp.]